MRKIILSIIVFTCLIKNNITAQEWSALGEGIGNAPFYGETWVNSLAMYNGELYAGGIFDSAGGIAANRIAKWNGTNWSPVGTGVMLNGGYNGHVRTMIVYGGELYVGGFFDSAGGIAAENIAKWNGTNWAPVGTGVNNVVIDFAILNGDLYACGDFGLAGGVYANGIAKWDGTNWSALSTGVTYGTIYSLAVYNGEIYAGGNFELAGDVYANSIAKWDGTNWSALSTGVGWGTIYSLAVYNGEIYAGGDFGLAGDVYVNGIAKWDGTSWSGLGSGIAGPNGGVYSMSVYKGVLYVGGGFSTAGNIPANQIAKWDGTYWSGLGQGVNGFVLKLLASDSALYVGGQFTYADTLSANMIVKWTGNCLNPLQPDIINGNDTVCNSSTQTYFVNQVTGATSYTWVLPTEWPGSSNTNSITTIPYNDGEFIISIWANNSCGNSPVQILDVFVNSLPQTPEFIDRGNEGYRVCKGTTDRFSVLAVPGAIDYTWILPNGWPGNSDSTSIITTVSSNSGDILVKANNNCGSSFYQIFPVFVDSIPAQPGVITGNIYTSTNFSNFYSIERVPGATYIRYIWSIQNRVIHDGLGANSIWTSWEKPGDYEISVQAINHCGISAAQKITIKVTEPDTNNPFDIKIFPNSTSGEFYLKAKRVQDKIIRTDILNINGQVIYRSGQLTGTNDYTQRLEIRKMAKGLYVVRVAIDDKIYVRKIVKAQ